MVDISTKDDTSRTAIAQSRVELTPSIVAAITDSELPKSKKSSTGTELPKRDKSRTDTALPKRAKLRNGRALQTAPESGQAVVALEP